MDTRSGRPERNDKGFVIRKQYKRKRTGDKEISKIQEYHQTVSDGQFKQAR